jgi:hypothetical protein
MMAEVPGYRQGLISGVKSLTKKGDANALGDLVAQDGDYLKTWAQMDALPGPSEFFDKFLGVLQEGAANGQEAADTPVLVFTQGQCYYPLNAPAAHYYPVGTFVTAVADQVVALDEAADLSTMIGKVCVPVKAGDPGVMFELRSKVMG